MGPERTPVTARLVAWLTAAGVPHAVIEHPPVYTSEEAARARGTRLEEGAKALVVRTEAGFVHLVLPADRKVDNGRVRELLGARRLRFATPEELEALTGCAPGAVPPFGNLFGLPVLADEGLQATERIAFNAGSHTVSITMGRQDFVRLSGARLARFTRE